MQHGDYKDINPPAIFLSTSIIFSNMIYVSAQYSINNKHSSLEYCLDLVIRRSLDSGANIQCESCIHTES